jgi:Na+/glutamate symporter
MLPDSALKSTVVRWRRANLLGSVTGMSSARSTLSRRRQVLNRQWAWITAGEERINLFISTKLAGVRYEQAVKAAVPFMAIMALDMAIMAIFPVIPLLLPHLLFGYPFPK